MTAPDALTALISRFWGKVERQNDKHKCWMWRGVRDRRGYGLFSVKGKGSVRAHRFAYEAVVGPIPDGLCLDHLCRTPSCVNPDHLEAVTLRENTLRGVGPTARNAKKTHCPVGHPLEGNNLLMARGFRVCRECRNQWFRDYRKKQKDARDAK